MPTDFLSPGFRQYLAALHGRRGPLMGFVVAVAIVAAVFAFILRPWFTATATLLPPAEGTESFGAIASLIQSSTMSKLGLSSTQTPSDLLAEVLRSRTLHEDLIRKFDLQHSYKSRNMDQALRALGKHMKVDVNKAGLVIISVEDHDAQRAADMANRLADELDRFNRETYNTNGKRTRVFLEQRLAAVMRDMARAESTLTEYEQRNKVVATSDAAAIGGMAAVMAERLSLEVKRSYITSYSRGDNPMLREIDAQKEAYEAQIAKMPALKQQGARLALQAELQKRLYTLLTAQYEDARVQESRDTPTITVLDAARAPFQRSRPKRTLIVVVSALVAAALGAGWVGLTFREGMRAGADAP